MARLDGQRAIVTGAARGIGRATALRLAAEGARVALVDVDDEALAAAASDVGDGSLALRADVADEGRWPAPSRTPSRPGTGSTW